MSDTLKSVAELVGSGQVRITDHGYDELAADRISVKVDYRFHGEKK